MVSVKIRCDKRPPTRWEIDVPFTLRFSLHFSTDHPYQDEGLSLKLKVTHREGQPAADHQNLPINWIGKPISEAGGCIIKPESCDCTQAGDALQYRLQDMSAQNFAGGFRWRMAFQLEARNPVTGKTDSFAWPLEEILFCPPKAARELAQLHIEHDRVFRELSEKVNHLKRCCRRAYRECRKSDDEVAAEREKVTKLKEEVQKLQNEVKTLKQDNKKTQESLDQEKRKLEQSMQREKHLVDMVDDMKAVGTDIKLASATTEDPDDIETAMSPVSDPDFNMDYPHVTSVRYRANKKRRRGSDAEDEDEHNKRIKREESVKSEEL